MRRARKTKRKDGLTMSEARAEMGVRVRPAVLLSDGRIVDERRARERRRDRSIPVWVPALSADLRVRFPDGARVFGPFLAHGDGTWSEGEGVVSWRSVRIWAVPGIGIPVRVTGGNRYSGGYLPEELSLVSRSGDDAAFVERFPDLPEPDLDGPFVLGEFDEKLAIDDEILGILADAGFTT